MEILSRFDVKKLYDATLTKNILRLPVAQRPSKFRVCILWLDYLNVPIGIQLQFPG